ncbi:TadE/TadG family type IV pilus assembly protein [Actibacterium sp. MT2.3-13A]|uniref:TadE/TadG family type IV pilus assembly protein n=1 Tax=Actibacterium sp. MT2.3-13A TaxID=2828332 RepID=UPI001BA99A4C|nr:TadE/TadG family type IV pilus assembly protein [Actibacterium sp. MT2.3-13A]
MVRRRGIRAFARNETGATLVEGLLVFPILLIVFSALIEFGFAVFQWNQAVKAVQLGARLAAVSDPLATDMTPLTADYSGNEGRETPSTPVTVSCGAGTTPCDGARLNRLVYGSDGVCDGSFGTSMPGMCDFNEYIRPANIRVSYQRSGLGYIGRPWGPVVTITLELDGLHFNLPFMGALLGVNEMTIPAHPVTVTSEDLCSSIAC